MPQIDALNAYFAKINIPTITPKGDIWPHFMHSALSSLPQTAELQSAVNLYNTWRQGEKPSPQTCQLAKANIKRYAAQTLEQESALCATYAIAAIYNVTQVVPALRYLAGTHALSTLSSTNEVSWDIYEARKQAHMAELHYQLQGWMPKLPSPSRAVDI